MSSYADTSFLVSLYTPDSNSPEAVRRMRTASLPLLFTSFGEVELTNAFQLRLFRKQVERSEIRAAYAAFRSHTRAGVINLQPTPEDAFEAARALSLRFTARLGVRALDVLHVASALVLGADAFHTFDNNQRKLANATGLKMA